VVDLVHRLDPRRVVEVDPVVDGEVGIVDDEFVQAKVLWGRSSSVRPWGR
jgi:hypothetical protein